MILGAILIIIALVLGGLQHIHHIYSGNHWYFYGSVGVVGLVGIVLVVWSFMKKAPKK
jgi:predicted tellurium resistance membrane protein TerC